MVCIYDIPVSFKIKEGHLKIEVKVKVKV